MIDGTASISYVALSFFRLESWQSCLHEKEQKKNCTTNLNSLQSNEHSKFTFFIDDLSRFYWTEFINVSNLY